MEKTSVKPLQEQDIRRAEYVGRVWYLDVDKGTKAGQRIEVSDLFRPETWASSVKQLTTSDLVRVMSRAHNYDFLLAVTAITQHGVLMRPWPHIPQGLETMRAVAHLAQLDHQQTLQNRVFRPQKTAEVEK